MVTAAIRNRVNLKIYQVSFHNFKMHWIPMMCKLKSTLKTLSGNEELKPWRGLTSLSIWKKILVSYLSILLTQLPESTRGPRFKSKRKDRDTLILLILIILKRLSKLIKTIKFHQEPRKMFQKVGNYPNFKNLWICCNRKIKFQPQTDRWLSRILKILTLNYLFLMINLISQAVNLLKIGKGISRFICNTVKVIKN
jgi:hypothetical protein